MSINCISHHIICDTNITRDHHFLGLIGSLDTLARFHPRSTFPVSIKNTFENGSAAKPFQTFVFNAREFAKLQGSPFVENLIRGSRGMDLDSKGKKKNNETCIRGSSLCSMPERNIRDERVEM